VHLYACTHDSWRTRSKRKEVPEW